MDLQYTSQRAPPKMSGGSREIPIPFLGLDTKLFFRNAPKKLEISRNLDGQGIIFVKSSGLASQGTTVGT